MEDTPLLPVLANATFADHSNGTIFARQLLSCLEEVNSTSSSSNWTAPNCLLSILSSSAEYYRHNRHPSLYGPDRATVAVPNETTTSSTHLFLIRDAVRFWVQRVLVPLVTLVGLFGNLLTILVMSQRRMSTSSTHIYLAALALSDALYLAFVFLLSLVHYPTIQSDLTLLKMLYWHSYPGLIFGCDCASNTSIWLTVCFTIERRDWYIVIRYPIKGKVLCTTSRAIKVILLVGLLTFLITLPTFFEWKVVFPEATNQSANSTNPPSVSLQNTELATNAIYRSFYHWFTVIAFIFVPLAILAIFNLFLIRSVRKSSQKRRQFIADQQPSGFIVGDKTAAPIVITGSLIHSPPPQSEHLKKPKSRSLMRLVSRHKSWRHSKPKPPLPEAPFTPTYRILLRQDAHITRLLIAVVLFFLICQLPSAVVIIYTASIGNNQTSAQQAVLQTLGNLFNLLVGINSAGNFTLYCLLSRKYRRTLLDLLRRMTKHQPN